MWQYKFLSHLQYEYVSITIDNLVSFQRQSNIKLASTNHTPPQISALFGGFILSLGLHII